MKRIAIKVATLMAVLIIPIKASSQTSEKEFPEHWFSSTADSKIEINYDDWDKVLKAAVVPAPAPTRKAAKDPDANINTRLKNRYKKETTLAGAKVFYEEFDKNQPMIDIVHKIRLSLESIPSEIKLSELSDDEQLAFWLNLYNVVVVDEINQVYKISNLEDLITGDQSLLERKLVTLEGHPLSLNDISSKILKRRFDGNPMVLYGLYQGYIGSPSIRTFAYTGGNVRRALMTNAFEFINSNRGTFIVKDQLTVSSFYQRNAEYFPSFDSDLKSHIREYLRDSEFEYLDATSKFSASINDWSVTDVYGSQRNFGGGTSTNPAAFLGMFSQGGAPVDSGEVANLEFMSNYVSQKSGAFGRFSPEIKTRLEQMRTTINESHSGSVTIQDVEEKESANDSTKKTNDQP